MRSFLKSAGVIAFKTGYGTRLNLDLQSIPETTSALFQFHPYVAFGMLGFRCGDILAAAQRLPERQGLVRRMHIVRTDDVDALRHGVEGRGNAPLDCLLLAPRHR